MRRIEFLSLSLSLVLVACFASTRVEAQAEGEQWGGLAEDGAGDVEDVDVGVSDYPVRYANRPLTLDPMMVAVDVGFRVLHLEFDTGFGTIDENFASLGFGGRIGVIENLTLGVSNNRGGGQWMPGQPQGAVSFLMSPDFEFGDIPIFGRYRFFDSELVELAADLVILIPTNSEFALSVGLPVRFHFSDMFALDTGFEFRVRIKDGPDDDTVTDLFIPVHPILSVTDNVALHLHTGIATPDFDGWVIPLHFGGSYTIAGETAPIADISAGFGFPVLFNDADTTAKIWQIDIDATVYFQL